MNTIRNELLIIQKLARSNGNREEDREFYTKELLEQYEYELKEKQEELEQQLKQVKYNLKVLDYVRKEIEK